MSFRLWQFSCTKHSWVLTRGNVIGLLKVCSHVTKFNPSPIFGLVFSGGSRIFPGGGANSQNCYYFSHFCRKLHENERIWTPGGGARPWRPPWIRQWCCQRRIQDFPVGGDANPKGSAPTYYLAKFCPKNYMGMKKIGPGGWETHIQNFSM